MNDISKLTGHLGYWMRLVSNQVSSSFRKKLETHDVSVVEWVVLRQLYAEKKLSPSILAEMTGMTRGAISKLLERLEQKAWIVRSEITTDRRYQEVKLSKSGEKLLPKLASLADENDCQFFDHLSRKEKDTLLKTLQKMVSFHGWSCPPLE